MNAMVQNVLKKYHIKFFTTFSKRNQVYSNVLIALLKESCLSYLRKIITEDIFTCSVTLPTTTGTHIIGVSR